MAKSLKPDARLAASLVRAQSFLAKSLDLGDFKSASAQSQAKVVRVKAEQVGFPSQEEK